MCRRLKGLQAIMAGMRGKLIIVIEFVKGHKIGLDQG